MTKKNKVETNKKLRHKYSIDRPTDRQTGGEIESITFSKAFEIDFML